MLEAIISLDKLIIYCYIKTEKFINGLIENMHRGYYINFNSVQRLKTVAKLYAQMLLSGNIDYNILYIASYNSDRQKCIMTIPDRQQLLRRVKLVLNNERLQRMLAEELLKIMEESGFTVKEAIDYRKQILVGAIATKQYMIANKTLDSFDNKLGIGDEQLAVKAQPLLKSSNGAINFDHLAKIKEVNYTEIKSLREGTQIPS